MSDIEKKDKSLDIRHSSLLSLKDSPELSLVYRKAERLAAAVHMVTDFMIADEPLRKRLRTGSLDILSSLLPEQQSALHSFSINIHEMMSFLEVAHASGQMSDMNYSVLYREYNNLRVLVVSKKDIIQSGERTLSRDFFDTVPPAAALTHMEARSTQKGSGKTSSVRREPVQTATVEAMHTRPQEKSSERREVIVKLIRTSGHISVKDASRLIPKYSEKTIQRELLAMVKEGILQKEGERRWSVYRFAT